MLMKEVVHPSEKLPLRHLAVQELADHLFELGESSHLPALARLYTILWHTDAYVIIVDINSSCIKRAVENKSCPSACSGL